MPAVDVSRHGAVQVVRLDDGKANALTAEAIASILDAVRTAEADASVGAVALFGRPGATFCAGFDLGVMRGNDLSAISGLVSDGGELVATLYGSRIPVIAGCAGHALAAGALILLGCDVRIGTDAPCKIGLNEVAIGMVLPDWAFTIAAERLDRSALQAAVATAQLTDGAGAVRAGYLDEVVAADVLEATVLERAEALATLNPVAYAGTAARLRGDVVTRIHSQVAVDRAAMKAPGV